ncbi:hypothetical protein F4054_22255 [Candidatus Poribacteria bacterium]|nr:hypothetical protein [Candidatus Poribacteria bacterium]MYK24974.1 hypothetical protein [Candidatus Poribacteria bacterium]
MLQKICLLIPYHDNCPCTATVYWQNSRQSQDNQLTTTLQVHE